MGIFDTNPVTTAADDQIPANNPGIRNEGDIKRVWYLDQIYDPDIHNPADMAKYIVPLELELVHDTANRRILQVTHVDRNATWKSTFQNYTLLEEDDSTSYDLFPVSEYGFLQGELALMIDFSVRPAVARVDSNATAPNAAYGILYKGSIIGEKGQIISATYSNQDLIDNQVKVSPVVYDNVENLTVMGANSFSVTQNEAALPNGTRCTLVYYDQAGRPIPPTYPVVVQQCAYLRDHQLDKRYVKSIELIAPWFTNSTTPNTMYIPVNLPLKAVEFRAMVHYSDGGDPVEYPVNSFNGDNGFRLHGVDQYKPTTPGQVSDAIVLTYQFSESEQAMIASPGAPRHMSATYQIVATPSQGAYGPRLYTYPYWDPATGYKLRHFLTDLDRKYCRDVTDYVTLNETSPVFNGQKYGEEQPMVFNLNMRDVSAIYEPWAFVQHTTITLYNAATATGRKWDVRHSYSKPPFTSLTLNFTPQTGGTNIASFVATDVDNFTDLAYWAFEPIYDPRQEVKAPAPTHFDILKVDGTARTAIPIASFDNLPVTDLSLTNGEGIYIRWVRRDDTGAELQLGVSAAVCVKTA